MILYHGSNQNIESIDLSKCRPNKDFGKGFYTTDIQEQAELWSIRISDRFGGSPCVTKYDFDLEKAHEDGLKIKIFNEPNKEWALFVMDNRNAESNFNHDYDIVRGPVADDRMARLFGLYEMDVIDLDAVVSGLVYKGLNSQFFFATTRSLEYLKKYERQG